MNRILDALRSPGAMMIALMLALLAQGEHTAQVFAFFSHSNGGNVQPLAYAFAAAVEVAVLLFVLKGHKLISFAFAVATLCTNIVYYAIGGIDLLSVALLPVLLLSALLPGVIVGYSHTIAEVQPALQPATARRFHWQFWRKPLERPTMNVAPIELLQTPVAIPVGTLMPSSTTPAQHSTESADKIGDIIQPAKLTPAQRRLQIAESGLQSSLQLQQVFGISKRTADADLAAVRKSLLQQNGVRHA